MKVINDMIMTLEKCVFYFILSFYFEISCQNYSCDDVLLSVYYIFSIGCPGKCHSIDLIEGLEMIRYQILDKRNSFLIYLYHEILSRYLYFTINIKNIKVNNTNMVIISLYQNIRLSISKCTNGFQK